MWRVAVWDSGACPPGTTQAEQLSSAQERPIPVVSVGSAGLTLRQQNERERERENVSPKVMDKPLTGNLAGSKPTAWGIVRQRGKTRSNTVTTLRTTIGRDCVHLQACVDKMSLEDLVSLFNLTNHQTPIYLLQRGLKRAKTCPTCDGKVQGIRRDKQKAHPIFQQGHGSRPFRMQAASLLLVLFGNFKVQLVPNCRVPRSTTQLTIEYLEN